MPYIPTKAQKVKNQNYWTDQRGLTDAEMAALEKHGSTPEVGLSDEEMTALESSGRNLADDRDSTERNSGYILNAMNVLPFSDKILAGLGTILPGGTDSYEKNLKYVRKIHDRYRKLEDDWSVGNILSGAVGMVASAPLYGAALKGARALTTLGGVAAPTSVGGSILNEMANLGLVGATVAPLTAAGEAGPTTTEALNAAKQSIAAGEPLISGAIGVGVGAVAPGANKLLQRVLMGARKSADKAARILAEQAIAGNKTPKQLTQDWERAAASEKPVALVDTGPESFRGAGQAAARMPGPGRDKAVPFLEERQAAQTQRVSDDVAQAYGGRPGSFFKTTEEITAARAAEAKPLYEQAFHPKPLVSQKIIQITHYPDGGKALNQGLRIAQNEGIPLEELVARDSSGNIIGYTTKALHYMKLGIDDMIESAKRTGDKSAMHAYMTMKRQLLEEVDRLNPAYAKARQVFAGHSANANALEMGRNATKLHPDQIASETSGLTAGEKEFYQRGFAQKLIEDVEATPDRASAVNRIFGTKAKRDRIRAVIGEKNYAELANRFGVENEMTKTNTAVLGGSQTAQRMSEQVDLDQAVGGLSPELAGGLVQSFFAGNVSALINKIGMKGVVYLLRGMNRKVRAEIVDMLFSTDPAKVRKAIMMISKEYKNAQAFNEFQREIAGTGAGISGKIDLTPDSVPME